MNVSWLYVPGDRPDRFAKALASGAHVVIVDLEDAVPPTAKAQARRAVTAWLPDAPPGRVEVRVNGLDTPWAADDLAALSGWPALRAVRVPKIESADGVHGARRQLPAGVPVVAMIETAVGVERAYEIATAAPTVDSVGLGEADLASDLGVADAGLDWARARIVNAARAAGLPAPAGSVYPHVRDLDGLAASCRHLRDLGFVGRTAIHPGQVAVIHDAFRPTPDEVSRAREVVAALASHGGVTALPDGRMVDPAMRGAAERVIALADALA